MPIELGAGQVKELPVHLTPIDTEEPIIISSKDTSIRDVTPDWNYGHWANMIVGAGEDPWYGDFIFRSLVEFTLPSIPSGLPIKGAKLWLYPSWIWTPQSAGQRIMAYRLTLSDWEEMEATWNIYKAGHPWPTPGGAYTTEDGAGSPIPSDIEWMEWNVLAQVQYARANNIPVQILLRKESEGYTGEGEGLQFVTKEREDPELWPRLVLDL